MTDCDLCRYFRVEHLSEGKGVWHCDSPEPTDILGQLMDEADDCPAWYPGEKQTTYTRDSGAWQHRCEDKGKGDILWQRHWKRWMLYTYADITKIAYCPWCGLALEAMPEVRE